MPEIRFSQNWNNKLAGKAFTTIRLMNQTKYVIGELYEIYLPQGREHKFMGYAEIVEIKHFKLDELNNYMALLDTGYRKTECTNIIKTMYKHKVKDWSKQWLSFILLEKINTKKSNQQAVTEKQEQN